MLCGGVQEVKHATPEIQKIADEMKPHVEKQTNKTFKTFKAMSFTSQVVAGTNYFIKVQVENEEYMHLRVFQPLPHTNETRKLSSVQYPKKLDDAIGYFN